MTLQPIDTRLAEYIPDSRVRVLVDDFFTHYKDSTLRTYECGLKLFAAFLGFERDDLHGAARKLFEAGPGEANAYTLRFLAFLQDRGCRQNAVNTYLAALKALVKLAKTTGVISWKIEIKAKRAETYRDTRGPGIEGVRRMLSSLQNRKDAKGLRDYAIVRLMWSLGLRRGAVARLDLEDVDPDNSILMVREKGRAEKSPRTLPDRTREALAAWISARGDNPGPLFINFDRAGKGDGRLTPKCIGDLTQRAGDDAGLKGVTPHKIRHAAITHSLDITNGDIRAVARFSGHRDIRVLTVYDDNREDLGGKISEALDNHI